MLTIVGAPTLSQRHKCIDHIYVFTRSGIFFGRIAKIDSNIRSVRCIACWLQHAQQQRPKWDDPSGIWATAIRYTDDLLVTQGDTSTQEV
jgi:hypothetical protein